MYIDFHTHGKLAKKLPFSADYTQWLFGQAREAGLDALCLTEHFNTQHFDKLYGHLVTVGRQQGDAFVLPNGLCVFPGMETDIAEGGHILSIGPLHAILELNQQLEPYKQRKSFLPFAQLLDLFERYPVLVGAAHPFRAGGHIPELPAEQLARLHFLDLNGKDMALEPILTEEQTRALGHMLGKPVVGGSDTHQAVQYGCIRTKLTHTCTTVSKLKGHIEAGRYTVEVSPYAKFQVKTAGLLKRALKEIHALGGDYVQVLTGCTECCDAVQEASCAECL